MSHKSIFIDPERCINCGACIVACKLEHNLPPYPTCPPISEPKGPNPIRVFQIGPDIKGGKVIQYFVVITCLHCTDPPCMYSCPTNAISKQESGIMQVDENKCIGCTLCLRACPIGAPQFNPEGKMVLCDMCVHRLLEGKKTACEAACVAKCIHVSTSDEISRKIGQRTALRIRRNTSIT